MAPAPPSLDRNSGASLAHLFVAPFGNNLLGKSNSPGEHRNRHSIAEDRIAAGDLHNDMLALQSKARLSLNEYNRIHQAPLGSGAEPSGRPSFVQISHDLQAVSHCGGVS